MEKHCVPSKYLVRVFKLRREDWMGCEGVEVRSKLTWFVDWHRS